MIRRWHAPQLFDRVTSMFMLSARALNCVVCNACVAGLRTCGRYHGVLSLVIHREARAWHLLLRSIHGCQ
eukprot:14802296-Alexandrium_andersonii.AAC.1